MIDRAFRTSPKYRRCIYTLTRKARRESPTVIKNLLDLCAFPIEFDITAVRHRDRIFKRIAERERNFRKNRTR